MLPSAFAVIFKSSRSKNAVILAGIVGQIGMTDDLHGFTALRVRDTDITHASRSHGW